MSKQEIPDFAALEDQQRYRYPNQPNQPHSRLKIHLLAPLHE
jgi:hypothetical protein